MNGEELVPVEHHRFGFREIFRVAVPAVWALLCTLFLSSAIWKGLSHLGISIDITALDIFELVLLALVFGLFWFSLQLPRRLGQYRTAVRHLRGFMLELSNKEKGLVDKPPYDYLMDNFLPPGATWRIHYFASLYYMFMDVAIISSIWFCIALGFFIYNLFWLPVSLSDILPLVVLAIAGVLESMSARRFLKDVELFSLFCLMVNKEKLTELIASAQESDALSRMQDALVLHPRLGRLFTKRLSRHNKPKSREGTETTK